MKTSKQFLFLRRWKRQIALTELQINYARPPSSDRCRAWCPGTVLFPTLSLHALRSLILLDIEHRVQRDLCTLLARSDCRTSLRLLIVDANECEDDFPNPAAWLSTFPALAVYLGTCARYRNYGEPRKADKTRQIPLACLSSTTAAFPSEKSGFLDAGQALLVELRWELAGSILGTTCSPTFDASTAEDGSLFRCSPSRLQGLRYLCLKSQEHESRFCTEAPLVNLKSLELRDVLFLYGRIPAHVHFTNWPMHELIGHGLFKNPVALPRLKKLELQYHSRSSGLSPFDLLSRLHAPLLEELELIAGFGWNYTSAIPPKIGSWPRFCQDHTTLRRLVICRAVPERPTSSWLAWLPNLKHLVLKDIAIDLSFFEEPVMRSLEYLGVPFTSLRAVDKGQSIASDELRQMMEECVDCLKLVDLRGCSFLLEEDKTWLSESGIAVIWGLRMRWEDRIYPDAYCRYFPGESVHDTDDV